MNKLKIVLPFFLALFVFSCQKKGCTDQTALNFNTKAKKDDGSCVYDQGDGQTPNDYNFNLQLKMLYNGQPLVLGETYSDYLQRPILFELIQFYLAELTLNTSDSQEVVASDIFLYDHTHTHIKANLPLGHYHGLTFGVGVPESMNHLDPSNYEADHPLSSSQNTWWSWATMYKFIMVEGRLDTTSGNWMTFAYHTGTDSLYREVEFPMAHITIEDNTTWEGTLSFDLYKMFASTDTIDMKTHRTNHSSPNDIPNGIILSKQFAESSQFE